MTYFKKQIFLTLIATFSFASPIFCAAPHTEKRLTKIKEIFPILPALQQETTKITNSWVTEYHAQKAQERAEQIEIEKRKNICKKICDSCLAM